MRDRPRDFYVAATALRSRKRRPNLRAEASAFRELSQSLAIDPVSTLRKLIDIARQLCGAGSAGLSLFRQDLADQPIVHWEVVSGTLSDQEGVEAPRANSSCGLCLDTGVAILISKPGRLFAHLAALPTSILEELIVPLYDSIGKPLGALWVAHHDELDRFHRDDLRILEQFAAQMILALHLQKQESERRRALVFKDAMIHEMNHRTKNTLQIASNLLSLQARAAASAPTREALLDGSARLSTLAKVHELLYAAPDGTQSILMPPLLRVVGDALQHLFGRAGSHVALEITADPITLPAQDAVAIAMLANEAVTNAYKHAFPNASRGTISVDLRCTATGTMILQIADTGIGLLFASRREGMGLRLIRTLATQLRGTLDIASTPGTRIALTIDALPASHACSRSVDSAQAELVT